MVLPRGVDHLSAVHDGGTGAPRCPSRHRPRPRLLPRRLLHKRPERGVVEWYRRNVGGVISGRAPLNVYSHVTQIGDPVLRSLTSPVDRDSIKYATLQVE